MFSLHRKRVEFRIKLIISALMPIRLQKIEEVLYLFYSRTPRQITDVTERDYASFPRHYFGQKLR